MSSSGKIIGGRPTAPTYAGERVGAMNDTGILYNAKASNTARLRASIARVAAGTGTGEWAFIGDSLTAGSTTGGGAYQASSMWPYYLRLLQNALPQASVTDGLIRTAFTANGIEPRWSSTNWGQWTGAFTTCMISQAVGANATLTVAYTGTNASVQYYDEADGTVFTVSAGGASSGAGFATVTCSGPAGWKRVNLAGFAAASTLKITVTTQGTTGAVIGPCSLWSPNTLLFHNLAQSGSQATGAGVKSWTDNTNVYPGGSFIQPHLIGLTKTDPDVVFIGLGANDLVNGVTAAVAKGGVATIASSYPNSDIILVATQPLNTTFVTDAAWQSYVSALYDLADALGWPLLDFRNINGTYATGFTAGNTVDGTGHFVAFANAMLGRLVARALM